MTTPDPVPRTTPRPNLPERPAWMHAAIALAFAPLLAGAVLSPLLSMLVDRLVFAVGDYRVVRAISASVHVGVPFVAGLLLLRYTRLGGWLGINRLLLWLVVPADLFVCAYLGALFNMTLLEGSSGPWIWLGGVGNVCMPWLLGLGLATLVATTLWLRVVRRRPAWVRRCRALLVELA